MPERKLHNSSRFMAPAFAVCGQQARLRQDFLVAIAEVNRLQILKFQAVVGGNEEGCGEKELRAARRQRALARNALIAHIQEHGCR
jgi:hypothetical protein